jgi:hypothetical protein
MRKLLDGTEVVELDIAVTLNIYTKCPWKYKLIDMETGVEYVGTLPDVSGDYNWKRLDET